MFRAPSAASLLATYVGTGVQLIGMSVVTMLFAVLGFLSPANRGGLMTAMLLLFVFMGVLGGYFSASLYKTFKVRPVFEQPALESTLLYGGNKNAWSLVCAPHKWDQFIQQ